MFVFFERGRIGCAYYDPVNFLIHVLEDTQETAHFDVAKSRQSLIYIDFEFLIVVHLPTGPGARAQFWIRSPLTFSLSALRPMTGSSISPAIPVRTFLGRRVILYAPALAALIPSFLSFFFAVAASGGFFQIRPQKDFRPERGRNNLLSLGLLSDLPEEILDPPEPDTSTELGNAYEFMQRRGRTEGDPTLRRWNASVRMSNFATLDTSPFAVCSMQLFSSLGGLFYQPQPLQLGSIGALLDYLVREKALGDLEPEGLRGLDVRGIVNLAL
jgi:hypothetical protein